MFTIGRQGVFSLGGWSPQIPTGFLVSRSTQDTFTLLVFSLTGLLPSMAGFSTPIQLTLAVAYEGPTTPAAETTGLGSSPFARRYLGNRVFFLFLRVLRCFSSPGCLPYPILFRYGYLDITPGRLPHSDTFGSKPACGYPKLFAAYRVLHRLLAPRHSPYALNNLTSRSLLKYFTYKT